MIRTVSALAIATLCMANEASFAADVNTDRVEELIDKLTIPRGLRAEGASRAIVDELVQMGSEIIPQINEALIDENPERSRRGSLIVVLGEIGDSSAVPALASCLSHEKLTYQHSAARALAKIDSEESVDALLKAYFDLPKDITLVWTISESLMQHCTNPAAIPALVRAIETHYRNNDPTTNSPEWVCELAMHLLVKLEAKETVPLLEKVAKEAKNRYIIGPALDALVVLDLNAAERALQYVKETTQDRYVREKAEADLVSVQKRIEAAKTAP